MIKDVCIYSISVDGWDNECEKSDVEDNMYLAIENPNRLKYPVTLPVLKVILTNTVTNQSRTTEYGTTSLYVYYYLILQSMVEAYTHDDQTVDQAV